MAIRSDLTLNVRKQTEYVKFIIPQGDNIDRKFYISFIDGSDPYTIPTGSIISFEMIKNDGHIIYNSCPKVDDNTILLEISSAISAESGRHPARFRFTNPSTGGLLHTFRFHILIDEGLDIDEAVANTSEFTALQDMELRVGDADIVISRAEEAIAEIEQINEEFQHAESLRVENENQRIENELARQAAEEARPDYVTLTQAEYDDLQENEKEDPKIFYEITDANDDIPNELMNLIEEAQEATEAAWQAASAQLPNIGVAGTYNKVTTDEKGRVISGSLETTIAGLGVTDVYTKSEVNNLDLKDNTVTFTEVSEDGELISGEKLPNLFGLIKKKFADVLASLANKLSPANIANNLVTTESGFALDARQGKILQDQINGVNHTYPDSFAGQTLTQILDDFISNNYKSALCFYWEGETQPPDTVGEIANNHINALYEFYKLTTTINYIFIRVTTSTAIYSKLMRFQDSYVFIPWVKTTNTVV